MNASHDQMDRVDRACLVESGGARDDSPSWNLGRVKQGDTIRVDGASPRVSRSKRTCRSPRRGASECNKHKVKPRTRAREDARPRSRKKVQKIG